MSGDVDRLADRSEATSPLSRLRDGREPGDDLVPAVTIVVVGMLAPLIAIGRYEEILAMYASAQWYVALAAIGFAAAAWMLVDGFDLDRVSFVGAAIAVPWFVVFPLAALLSGLGVPLVDTFVFRDAFFEYGLAIATAAGAVTVLSLVAEELSIRRPRSPGRRRVSLAAGTTVLLAMGAGTAVRYASPPRAAIEDVSLSYGGRDASFQIAVDTDADALHATVVAPDGSTTRERLTTGWEPHEMATIRILHPERSLHYGTFEVRVATAWGNGVDSRSITVEDGPVLSITGADAGTASGDDVRVTATVANQGDVTARADVALRGLDEPELDATTVTIEAGESSAVVLEQPRAAFEADGGEHTYVSVSLEGSDREHDRKRVDRSDV